MKKLLYHAISLLCVWIGFDVQYCRAQGEASTYFNVFVPPNNDPVKRNVCLVVTAIFDDTHFEIEDDGADGDTDDSKSGTLSKGQSYILYIADNGINDDARYASGGVWKQDGDYFFVKSNKNVLYHNLLIVIGNMILCHRSAKKGLVKSSSSMLRKPLVLKET
jgi:hypothetical protein